MRGTPTDPNIGRCLSGRYQLIELIGTGAMGRVYLAHDTLLGGVPVAVKFLAKTLLNERMKTRFAHEARTGAQLGQKSIHIVRVLDYGVSDDEVPFYVMEYLKGESLSDLITVRPLPLLRFLSLMRHVCLGLQYAHIGITIDGKLCPIIHRDIKPSNVLVTQDTSLGELAKILDFGIAKFISDQTEQTSSFMGTLAYCSPEQMEGRELDSRSDIYSLGIMMFEMLTGRVPLQADAHSIGSWYKAHHFQAPTPLSQAYPKDDFLPKPLEELVMACLAKLPSDRPQTVTEILKRLEELERQVSDRSSSAPLLKTQQKPDSNKPNPTLIHLPQSSLEQVCWQASWPSDKPIAKIVFPHVIRTIQAVAPSLWVMLPLEDIQKRLLSVRYNQFLCLMSPHPMLLWITVIYDPALGPRWLPCYLDLKLRRNQEITMLLAETGSYPLLLFALENPQRCAQVMSLNISTEQCQLLRDWVQTSQTQVSNASPTMSKDLLKTELEKLKPRILRNLEQSKQMMLPIQGR